MSRATVSVRTADAADIPALVSLWSQLQELGPRRAGRGGDTPEAMQERYAAALADPARRLIVAADENDEVVGMALLSAGSGSTLMDVPAVSMSHVFVADGRRHRGAGKALVAAALGYADDCGVDQVSVSVYPQSRDANRFYARLGFSPMVVRRVAPVAVVRRKLASTESRAAVLRRELTSPRRPTLRLAARRRLIAAATPEAKPVKE